MTKISPARKIAHRTLIYAREHQAFSTEIVYAICDKNSLTAEDKSFTVKLVRGVAGHTICLDKIINCHLKSKISPSVRDALKISTFEILYLKKETHIAVSQGVELVKSVAKNATGLANAVLRKIANEELPEDELLKAGFPEWLGDYVKENCQEGFISLSEEEPKLQFANNALNPPMAAMIAPIEEAKAGHIIIADKSAQVIAEQVAKTCKEIDAKSLLEIGSGRGTKTALIESFMASIDYRLDVHDVLDNSERRLKELNNKATICKFKVTNTFCEDATNVNLKNKYDVVFIDAPCTGLGTLRRHPEIKGRIRYDDVAKSANLDFEILQNCCKFVNEDGSIFYSTCTITHEENEDVINEFLGSTRGQSFILDRSVREAKLTADSDAHFCVCLKGKHTL